MAGPGLPLPLRNALARLALDAFDDEQARSTLRWLAESPGTAPAPAVAERLATLHLVEVGETDLLPVHLPWRAAVRARAHRALHAALEAGPRAPHPPVERALGRAAALWAQGLFFEVHEILEPVWRTSRGAMRDALQGLIQVAAAWHHLAHGNRRGARKLLDEGRARLAGARDALPALDVESLLAASAAWRAALDSGAELPDTLPLSLRLRRPR